mgnify:CR=1 FL=1
MIYLTKEDCYCDLIDFYKNVAAKMGYNRLQIATMSFDCRRIRVTKPVQDAIWAYYRDAMDASDQELAMLWVCSGPKADLEGESYAAESKDGFLTFGADTDGLFPIGVLVATTNIAQRMDTDHSFSKFVEVAFNRFWNGDWGDMCDEDKFWNIFSLKRDCGRLHGTYIYSETGETIWIITEADRSVTTILFPSEY